jgi:hypothetical protein
MADYEIKISPEFHQLVVTECLPKLEELRDAFPREMKARTHDITHDLDNSISSTLDYHTGDIRVEVTSDHAIPHEFGWTAPDGTEEPAKPFFRPVLFKKRGRL